MIAQFRLSLRSDKFNYHFTWRLECVRKRISSLASYTLLLGKENILTNVVVKNETRFVAYGYRDNETQRDVVRAFPNSHILRSTFAS
jgi:hypothetical protein